MNNEGLPPVQGMKKETPLILSGYVVPNMLVRLQYTDTVPHISDSIPSNPFKLIQPATEPNERLYKKGWYFAPGGSEDPFQYTELTTLQLFCKRLVDHLNENYPIVYKGSRMRWLPGVLQTTLLKGFGTVQIDFDEAYRYNQLFKEGLEDFVGEEVFSRYENAERRSEKRQRNRGALVQSELNTIKRTVSKYDPDRVERGVKKLMREKGLSSHNAFKQVMENNLNLYNVNVEGVGEAYGPWLNGFVEPEEEFEEANNNVYNGGANVKPVNARVKKQAVAPPPLPQQQQQQATHTLTSALWHVETANQKRKRFANAANKRAKNGTKKRKARKTRKN